MQYTREQVLSRLRATLVDGKPIVGAGAGAGVSAKFAERGGADLIIIYNSGRYRMGGLSSWVGLLPVGDANGIVIEMGEREILPVVREAPVIAGIFGADPTRVMSNYLQTLSRVGFSGVINFPTVALADGRYREALESGGMGFRKEVEAIGLARKLNLFTMAYVFNSEEASAMAEVGVDVLVAHMGHTGGGSIGASKTKTLDEAVRDTQAILEAGEVISKEIITLVHGGPIATPEDTAYILANTNAVGFIGASSMERIPIEVPLEETTRAFKSIPLRKR